MKVAAAVLTASNCREVSLFANYTSSKGTVETPLDQPLLYTESGDGMWNVCYYYSNMHNVGARGSI